MPTDKIKRAITWIRKTLEITEKTELPGTIDGKIIPALDAFGWERGAELEFVTAAAAGVTTIVQLPNVPEGEAHYFLSCHLTHDSVEGARQMAIAMRIDPDAVASGVSITSTVLVTQFHFLAMQRPILVPPRGRLIGRVDALNIPAGRTFTIAGQFLRLPIGEYVTGSPYG